MPKRRIIHQYTHSGDAVMCYEYSRTPSPSEIHRFCDWLPDFTGLTRRRPSEIFASTAPTRISQWITRTSHLDRKNSVKTYSVSLLIDIVFGFRKISHRQTIIHFSAIGLKRGWTHVVVNALPCSKYPILSKTRLSAIIPSRISHVGTLFLCHAIMQRQFTPEIL